MSVLRYVRRSPRALVDEAEQRLAFLESRFGFRRQRADGAVLAYRNGDELVKLTRDAKPFLGEAIFLEWFPAVLPGGRYLYSGVIRRGTREEYAEELDAMVTALREDLPRARRLHERDQRGHR